MRAIDSTRDLAKFLVKYEYGPNLTARLDSLKNIPFTQHIVNEIVLWKLNRYVLLSESVLQKVEAVKNLNAGEHWQGKSILQSLLETHGVDLPMASTILRFRNPMVFQILDRHAYRAIYGKDYKHSTSIDSKIDIYFDYLDELTVLCKKKGLAFETIDRVLYMFDKEVNGSL